VVCLEGFISVTPPPHFIRPFCPVHIIRVALPSPSDHYSI
jgi:hypothetical protein